MAPRRRSARLLLATLLAVASVLLPASPVGAHTSLVESHPSNRAIVQQAPALLRLVFANEVDPTSVSAELKRLDGSVVPGLARTTPDAPASFVLEFSVPEDLPAGTYGVPWQAIGPDGHRVAGEIVFGVDPAGDGSVAAEVAAATFGSVSSGDRMLDAAGVLSRALWYLGLSLAVGALAAIWWLLGTPSPAARPLQRAVRGWAELAVGLAACAALGRWLVAALVLRRAGIGDGSAAQRTLDALRSASGGWWLLALGALALVALSLHRLTGATERDRLATHALRTAAISLGFAALASVASGHASSYPDPLLSQLVAGLHLAAAALWVGPLAIVLLARADPTWRALPAQERAVVLAGLLRSFSPWAAGALAVLAVTGLRTIAVTSGTDLLQTSWGTVAVAKMVLVVAVAVPLGAHHHRRVRAAATRSDERGDAARLHLGSQRFTRTLTFEAGVLLLALGLGATMLSLTPALRIGADDLAALRSSLLDENVLGGAPVTDVAQCVDLEVGKPNCYRDYFATIMRTSDASDAVAEIERLSTTDEFVMIDCHQITHDLGEDAVEHYGGLAEAFAYGGAACWSGYYHGIVETALSLLDDGELEATLADVCTAVADPVYTFDHYNCVHGTGHGLMLRTDNDLFGSLEICGTFPDPWERTSCWGGVYMENVIAAQSGEDAVFDDADPLYPCTAVGDDEAEPCLLMQTSYVLWSNGYDYPAAFALCDELDGWKAENCYQSMGRDISGNHLLDVAKVIEHCDLGAEGLREWCYAGASLNAVFNDHGTANADALCAAVEERWRQVCEDNRDGAASTLT